MKKLFEVTYKYQSANGTSVYKTINNLDRKRAEALCKVIERTDGYKLVNLNVQ